MIHLPSSLQTCSLLSQSTELHGVATLTRSLLGSEAVPLSWFITIPSKCAVETAQIVSARFSENYDLVLFGLIKRHKAHTFVEYKLGKLNVQLT